MPKPTLKDIAQAAGVSAMTVSKALNGKPGVSEDRRKEICDIAKRMNYAPNLIAKSLRVDETKTIGVVLSDTSEMVISKVLRVFRTALRITVTASSLQTPTTSPSVSFKPSACC